MGDNVLKEKSDAAAASLLELLEWLKSKAGDEAAQKSQLAALGALLKQAKGVAIIGATKYGLGLAGGFADGLLVARLPGGGWSGPSFFTGSSFSVGLTAGVQTLRELVVILSDRSMRRFKAHRRFALGTDLNVVAWRHDLVTDAGADIGDVLRHRIKGELDAVRYAHGSGVMVDWSLRGSNLDEDSVLNKRCYGAAGEAPGILEGAATPLPGSCDALFAALRQLEEPAA